MSGFHNLMLAQGGGAVETLNASLPATITVSDYSPGTGKAVASITFNTDGSYTLYEKYGGTSSGTWKTGTGTGTDYDVRATTISGSLSAGTTGAWLQLSSAQEFQVSRGGLVGGLKVWVGTIEIRKHSNPPEVIFTSSEVTLSAENGGSGV